MCILGMASIGNVIHFEIFLDQKTMEAIQLKMNPLFDANDESDYKCDGVEPAIFQGGEVPMKPSSPNHTIAMQWFARAYRVGQISHPPTYLLMASMPALAFLDHILRGDIVIHFERSTYGLKKAMNKTHYPDIGLQLNKIPDDVAEEILDETMTQLFGSKSRRLQTDVEGSTRF